MNLNRIFRAGRVRRWHSNPDMAHTVDPIDAHSGRVARIIAALHPSPSAALIIEALRHDDGEVATGDMHTEVKRANPDMAARLDEMEQVERMATWGQAFTLSPTDEAWLKFADRLDAYMWAKHQAPHILSGDGWPAARDRLMQQAQELGGMALCNEVSKAI